MALNKIIVQGRLVRDPEFKKTPNGISFTKFTVACDRDFSSGNEKITDFIDCKAWRQSAEFVSKYFEKGSEILCEGALHIEAYTTKEGEKRTRPVIQIDKVYFAGKKKASESEYSEQEKAMPPVMEEYAEEGDLPF